MGVQVDQTIPCEHAVHVLIVLVPVRILPAGEMDRGADIPCGREVQIRPQLERLPGNAGNPVALADGDVAIDVGRAVLRRRLDETRLVGRIDQAVVRRKRQSGKFPVQPELQASTLRLTDVLEKSGDPGVGTVRDELDVVVVDGVVGRNIPPDVA